ncbi:LapA family protein [Amycolatopsis circi]|uniref:LapA family protein n=1 Tax=Amycolatopsis circi TaxID=871959 RepID=UPI000E28792E|nr:LapA family protein [Amycolatopsis circi]
MLWLFGQIWLWLLVSFLLGAAVMWLFTRAARPKADPDPGPGSGSGSGSGAGIGAEAQPYRPAAAPVEAPTEETRHIPRANPYEDYEEPAYPHYDDQPERVYNDYPEVDPDEPYDERRPTHDSAGHPLPDPEPRLSGELSWPDDDQRSPHWPHDDEPAPRRPGRSG